MLKFSLESILLISQLVLYLFLLINTVNENSLCLGREIAANFISLYNLMERILLLNGSVLDFLYVEGVRIVRNLGKEVGANSVFLDELINEGVGVSGLDSLQLVEF